MEGGPLLSPWRRRHWSPPLRGTFVCPPSGPKATFLISYYAFISILRSPALPDKKQVALRTNFTAVARQIGKERVPEQVWKEALKIVPQIGNEPAAGALKEV
ncbi:unnamed protein product [Prorocentrum cordatum]|uniref:Uncharacterized protein n=1 Tax=Prorocentrum cordatum TaxID=2364126 RepID=A0ABN9VM43_9DINO|nr:unnamed protein product [Polarella glacialis]